MVNKRKLIKNLRVEWKDSTGENLSIDEAEKMLDFEEAKSAESYIKTFSGKRRKIIW